MSETTNDEGTFLYSKRSVDRVKLTKEWYSIKETCGILQLSQVWVRRQLKQNKLVGKLQDGKWMISRKSILSKLEMLEEKDERLERRMKGEEITSYQVPSLKACDIISRRVRKDKKLTQEQRELFLESIESYRRFFQSRLVEIRKNRS